MPDLALENARNVSINLKGEHGKYIMMQLHFAAKWILISEVTFFSGKFSKTTCRKIGRILYGAFVLTVENRHNGPKSCPKSHLDFSLSSLGQIGVRTNGPL